MMHICCNNVLAYFSRNLGDCEMWALYVFPFGCSCFLKGKVEQEGPKCCLLSEGTWLV